MVRDPEKIVLDAIAAALERVSIRPGAKILIALSGGVDSVALTHALLDLRARFGCSVAAAHLNHRIRGVESDRDESFVRRLCAQLGIELIVEHADGLDADSPNLEERAREARHDFLNHAAEACRADYIALAHHADDQAETVLMRLLRGAGATGLAGMSERGPGKLIRPMLTRTQAEILAVARARALEFVEDSTNSSVSMLRNRFRADLIPMLERDYAPGLRTRLVELADEMRGLDDLVTQFAAGELASMRAGPNVLDVSRFHGLHRAVQPVVLRLFVAASMGLLRGVSRTHIDALRRLVLESGPSASISLPGGFRAEREYNLVRLVRARGTRVAHNPREAMYRVALDLDGVTMVPAANVSFAAETIASADAPMPDTLSVAIFDASKIATAGLYVRNFVRGDRIHPLGMRGARKVHDVFVDRKLPRARRGSFPIVTLGENGEIAWLPGMVRSDCAKVTKATETILRVEARAIPA